MIVQIPLFIWESKTIGRVLHNTNKVPPVLSARISFSRRRVQAGVGSALSQSQYFHQHQTPTRVNHKLRTYPKAPSIHTDLPTHKPNHAPATHICMHPHSTRPTFVQYLCISPHFSLAKSTSLPFNPTPTASSVKCNRCSELKHAPQDGRSCLLHVSTHCLMTAV